MSHRAAEALALVLVASLLLVVWWADSAQAAVRAGSAPPKATEQADDPLTPYHAHWHEVGERLAGIPQDSPLEPPPPCEASSGLTPEANKALAKCMLYTYNHVSMLQQEAGTGAYLGWHDARQWDCLERLWGPLESRWDQHAANPRSSAYGLPQALPGSKMGWGWQHDVTLQVAFGLRYVASPRYGSPCAALDFRLAHGYY